MKRALAAWVLVLISLASRLAAINQAPAVEMAREGITISRLPPILGDEEVRKQLGTGLTTSFAFQASARGAAGKVQGGARVDVRYDLWDEVYIVTRIDATGHAAKVSLPSFERLAEWWREARLVVIRTPAAAARPGRRDRSAGDPFLPGRTARRPALVFPGALGREDGRRRRGLRRGGGPARVVQPGDQPADGHLDRKARPARVSMEVAGSGWKEAMNVRSALVTLCGMLLAAAAILWLFDRQIFGPWFRLGVQPEIVSALERSMADQKALARLDPGRREDYHARFEADQELLNHLRILEHNRTAITRRWEILLLAAVLLLLAAVGGLHLLRQSRLQARLERLRLALIALSDGQEDLEIGDRGRDTVGRIAGMIEETSRAMARDRKRLASLKNLSGWQETARRHAHEMRTPLTAARLELARLERLLEAPESEDARQVAVSVGEELERLGRFTQQFTSFARIPSPRPQVHDLGKVVEEFVGTFAAAWPNLELRFEAPGHPLPAALDRDMLRQVLVNLCDNSSLAIRGADGERRGAMTLRAGESGRGVQLDVTDDGPGIAPEVRSRVFEPYATTRRVGEGMGLGLAISKKILLDHGGDLELVASSGAGTTFRLTFPRRLEDAAA